MIVSTTLVSNVLDVAGCAVAVVVAAVVVGGGGVSTTPLVGIFPAKTGTDTSPVRAIANTKRFMLSSFAIEDATVVVSKIAKAQKLLRIGGSEV
jgi:hypothetical protein